MTLSGDFKKRRVEATKNASTMKGILLQMYDHKCSNCGSTSDLQVDHIVSVIEGGSDEITNLQILCGACNRKKGAKRGMWNHPQPINEDDVIMRKEVQLDTEIIERLSAMAEADYMRLKPYMEKVLIKHSDKANIPNDKIK